MKGVFYIDGEFVASDKAVLPACDLAVLRGYGAFDFLRTYNGRPFRLKEHVRRLLNSAGQIGIHSKQGPEEIFDLTNQALAKRDFGEANIRLILTGGSSEDGILPDGKPRLLIFVTPLRIMPPEWYTAGVKIITWAHDRYLPAAKTTNYIPAILALVQARSQDAVEAVYIRQDDEVMEGTTSNLFLVNRGRLFTPDTGVLMGITRKAVLEVVQKEFEVTFQSIFKKDLLQADEVFLTSSNKEVAPVVNVDGHTVGGGSIGPVSRKVMDMWKKFTEAY